MMGSCWGIDHLSEVKHEGTKVTKTHEEADGYREPAAKARAGVVSSQVIAAAIEVHRQLGPGLLESVYRACLGQELTLRGLDQRQEVPLPVTYRGLALEVGHRLDLLVQDLVMVELKSVERLEPVHQLQLLSYLRLSGRWLGLLINFNTDLLEHGLRRVLDG